MTPEGPKTAADDAKRRVLESVLHHEQDATIVDSPPGAGKTSLAESVVATAVKHKRWSVALVAPTIEQTLDFSRRIRADYKHFPAQYLHSGDRPPPPSALPRDVLATDDLRALSPGPGLTVSTVDKMFFSVPQLAGMFDLLVCDEAYQVMAKKLMPLYDLAKRILLVGDPGQLLPIMKGDVARFEAASNKVHWPAPRELLRRHGRLPHVQLPATWRLPQDTVDLVQPAFYPQMAFQSGAVAEERRIRFKASGMGDAIDETLDVLADGGSIVSLLLPPLPIATDGVDEELAALTAQLIARMLGRGVSCGKTALMPEDVGYTDAHVASNEAVKRHLRAMGIRGVHATTPEIWQGQERQIMVAKHTLSGVRRFGEFELQTGRMCVMTSRHKLGCIVVGRDGIGAALEEHQHNCADWPSGAESLEWTGWRAHRTFWAGLESKSRIVRA